ncbi:MAG: Multi-sensor signal transduction histidine kinase [Candidatus Moranbacteria bacterium GW2011_GWF2_36_839]|nr:MAG: Multi-sensor signal transduction histidine kinase [Candidatus Moranbacteria bacterium GW2011_GWF1_36_78]KKQ17440.1 MAG: Multi-sensor signal transduction histidine kinase [Candidatus Moranbacteria bacterium GW2011_GWF2_36_839]HAT73907.1 hypothetical protein [Candidatus Moranbacteria bacterium]HBY10567.1 hypothetical protein [Candidatus Moranbacteria bacterium]
MMRMGLKNKILVSLFLVVFLCGIIASYFIYTQSKKNLSEYKKDSLETLILERKNRVADFFGNSLSLAEKISKRQEIINYIENEGEIQEASILLILQNYNIGEKYSAMYIMNKNGQTMVSTDESFIGKDYSFREYFQRAVSGEPWADMAIGSTSNIPGYYVSYPIKNREKVIGVTVLKIIPEHLNKIFTKESIGGNNDTDFIFVDVNGVVIYSSDEKKNYHSLGNLTEEKKREIFESKKFASKEILPLDYDEIQKEIDKISTIPSSYSLNDEADGAQELLMAIKVENFPFFVIAEANLDKMLASIRDISLWLVALFLMVIVIGGFTASFFITRFLRPLRELKNIADDVSRGKYEKLKIIKTNDEIEELSWGLKKMADSLIKLKKGAEEKVVERSRELEKMNSYMTGREIKMIELKKKIEELEKSKNIKNDK